MDPSAEMFFSTRIARNIAVGDIVVVCQQFIREGNGDAGALELIEMMKPGAPCGFRVTHAVAGLVEELQVSGSGAGGGTLAVESFPAGELVEFPQQHHEQDGCSDTECGRPRRS